MVDCRLPRIVEFVLVEEHADEVVASRSRLIALSRRPGQSPVRSAVRRRSLSWIWVGCWSNSCYRMVDASVVAPRSSSKFT